MEGERVSVEIGLGGLSIYDSNGRKQRSLELGHISRSAFVPEARFCVAASVFFTPCSPFPLRWQCRGSQLVLFIKTPSEMEERQITLTVKPGLRPCLSHRGGP